MQMNRMIMINDNRILVPKSKSMPQKALAGQIFSYDTIFAVAIWKSTEKGCVSELTIVPMK